jgi:hypothetical protein
MSTYQTYDWVHVVRYIVSICDLCLLQNNDYNFMKQIVIENHTVAWGVQPLHSDLSSWPWNSINQDLIKIILQCSAYDNYIVF